MRARTLVATLALGAVVAGCASAPPRQEPDLGIAVPERWTAAAPPVEAPVAAPAWTALGSPRLEQAVAEALEHNRSLRSAATRIELAAAEARIAGAPLYPAVDAGANAGRQKQIFLGLDFGDAVATDVPGVPAPPSGPIVSRFSSYGVSLNTSWEADLWGRIRSGKVAALADLQAAAADVEALRQSIAAQTAKAWLAAVEARRQLALAEQTVASFRGSAAWVRERYVRGLRPSLELRLALANVATAEALVESRRDQLQRVLRQLEILLGRYPAAAIGLPDALPELPGAVPAGLPAELIARRPDLVAAERRLAAADARTAQARAALYPSLVLTGSTGTTTDALDDLLDGDFSVWSLAGNLLQPLFQGGRLRAAVDRSRSAAEQALWSYADAALGAYAEVESTLAAEALLARRVAALAEATDQSVAARALAETRYRAGLEEFVTVLEAQRRALDAESQLLVVRRLRLDNRIDLHLALGGGFTPEPPVETAIRRAPERGSEDDRS